MNFFRFSSRYAAFIYSIFMREEAVSWVIRKCRCLKCSSFQTCFKYCLYQKAGTINYVLHPIHFTYKIERNSREIKWLIHSHIAEWRSKWEAGRGRNPDSLSLVLYVSCYSKVQLNIVKSYKSHIIYLRLWKCDRWRVLSGPDLPWSSERIMVLLESRLWLWHF